MYDHQNQLLIKKILSKNPDPNIQQEYGRLINPSAYAHSVGGLLKDGGRSLSPQLSE